MKTDGREESKSFSEEEVGKNNVQLNSFEAEQRKAGIKEIPAILGLKSITRTS